MSLPLQPVTLTPEQIGDLDRKLAVMRHNVNNSLAMLVATAEIMRRKPESAIRFANSFTEQPQKIAEEIKQFSELLQTTLRMNQEG